MNSLDCNYFVYERERKEFYSGLLLSEGAIPLGKVRKNSCSTLFLAHGVLRKNARLDFTEGLKIKQRTGIRAPSSSHP
jgi:hypothetical protein